ncbi:MAG: fumarylacetoacetate hydrolase family protein [Acetobacteraceae bacterium]
MVALNDAIRATLPADAAGAALAGRVWRPDVGGPSVVAVRDGSLFDISQSFPTMRDLCEAPDPARALHDAPGVSLGPVAAVLANTPPESRARDRPWLLAPIDLQAIKAAGVTFVVSMLERVIEERARGNPAAAVAIRTEVERLVGADLANLRPGSPEAAALKEVLIREGAWSQYLEVGIGPDVELFTKAQPLSAVGTGVDAGIHRKSEWNNPEPEAVLAIASSGRIVGATLGNDVNLRDFEGRSALLLGKAKDNNASCAIGPFLRFFDDRFALDDIRRAEIALIVEGTDGFRLEDTSTLARISRDPAAIAADLFAPEHHYPDGAVLFLGTMFAPIADRGAEGMGFTHKYGDIVIIEEPRLGRLVNRIAPADACAAWSFGTAALMRNLGRRGLLQ